MKREEKIMDVAKTFDDALQSDRDVNIAFGGMTGEGKTTCMWQLYKSFCKIRGTTPDFNCMTWDRQEVLNWVDGDSDGKGQLPQFSGIIADELISMFYKRNWYEDDQKSAIELFNKCRDRHLLILGAVPNFWDLDGGMLTRFRFYVFIPYRGTAWVFQQENNPFSTDQWNKNENRKVFRKKKNPYHCPNFLFEFHFKDFEPEEKKAYLEIRNTKRKNTEGQNKKKPVEKYGRIKSQRDAIIRFAYEMNAGTQKQIAEACEISQQHVADVCNGVA